MTLKKHLLISIGSAFVLLSIAIATGLMALRNAAEDFSEALRHDVAFQSAVADMYAGGLQAASSLRAIVLDPKNKSGYDNLDKGLADFETALKTAQSLPPIENLSPDVLTKIATLHTQRKELITQAKTLAQTDTPAAIALLNAQEIPLWRQIRQQILDARKAVQGTAEQTKSESVAHTNHSFNLTLILSLLALGIAVYSLASILRLLGGTLGADPAEVARIARQVADGNLGQRIPATRPGSVIDAMREMQDRLIAIIRQIHEDTDALASAANVLAENEQRVTQSVSAQTNDVSEMAAAVQELTVSIRQVADFGKETAGIARKSGQKAEQGQALIQRLGTEMNAAAETVSNAAHEISLLEQESTRIAAVVQTIQDVAEQTNLLALNAAIEAARAGEHGRGFAVVADEVRKLAERTAQSTTEIRQTIDRVRTGILAATQRMGTSVEAINNNVTLLDEAMQTIHGMNAASAEVVQTINDISHSIDEQTSVSALISQRIEAISQAAEQNTQAVMAEEDETKAVRRRSEQLKKAVLAFTLPDARG